MLQKSNYTEWIKNKKPIQIQKNRHKITRIRRPDTETETKTGTEEETDKEN